MASPNIILITANAWPWNALGVTGELPLATPNLDSLANHGIVLDQTICPCPTEYVSLVSLLWGQTPIEHRCWTETDPLPDPKRALPALLRARHYVTLAAGDFPASLNPLQDHFDAFVHAGNRNASAEDRDSVAWAGDQAVRHIQPMNEPFFMWIHFRVAQAPHLVPAPWNTLCDAKAAALDGAAERKQTLLARYGSMSQIDHQIGRVLASLTARGMTNNLIVFSAAAGSALESLDPGEGLEAAHDAVIRVPLIIAGLRGQQRNVRDAALAQTSDIPATLLEICQGEDRLGRSLLAPLMGKGGIARTVAVSSIDTQTHLARSARYKLVESASPARKAFYDLQSDPNEQINLYHTAKGGTIQSALARYLPVG
ncbi:MAG: sulfatase-like hydrolase/transferase [Candidatus Hydrogenedentes bacterium]|nr:sulfatase-like hydrolase/transferase [Candidatus Hydrogenedentota bacterium]